MFDWVTERWGYFKAFLGRVHQKVSDQLERQRRKRTGTKLAVVGPMASGKTVVHTFLATGALTTEYQPTLNVVAKPPRTIELQSIAEARKKEPVHKYLAERLDVTGDFVTAPTAWQRALKDAFLVVYLFDVNRFIGRNTDAAAYRRLVVSGCEFAGGLISHSDTRVVLGGTHCDLLPDWSLSSKAMSATLRVLARYDELDEAIAHISKNTKDEAGVIVGALNTVDDASEFLYSLFEDEG